MEYTLNLVFICTDGSKSTLNIEGVKPDITSEEVNALMDIIISKNIFIPKHGSYTSKSGASVTTKKVTDFTVA
ncbi:MAG: DUF2922 domain-containing protein [Clostridium sp.]|nr:DUF2922 domain-containing protein [Clostridium sp.]